jgi:hypothetical protein
MSIIEKIYGDIDFNAIATDAAFKEDSVRERIIMPMLAELGCDGDSIVRSKTLAHPFLTVGTGKRPLTLIPDYLIRLSDGGYLVLDAKSPAEDVTSVDNLGQCHSYATHMEVNAAYFALCNGLRFALYRTASPQMPTLLFDMQDIDAHWTALQTLLFPKKRIGAAALPAQRPAPPFDYEHRPILEEIPVLHESLHKGETISCIRERPSPA